jgi:hypothetical protein
MVLQAWNRQIPLYWSFRILSGGHDVEVLGKVVAIPWRQAAVTLNVPYYI